MPVAKRHTSLLSLLMREGFSGREGSLPSADIGGTILTLYLHCRRFLLEWLSFLHRYVPVGLLEVMPQAMNWRTVHYCGRNNLETLLARQVMFDVSQQLGIDRKCLQQAAPAAGCG